MGLDDVYQNNVNKSPINRAGISTGMPASRERDPNQVKLEQDVFAKMRAAIPKPKEDSVSVPKDSIQSVGLEQALKELLNGTESIDDKS
tara:strand:- start:361 stop:627 length:267 start_codon:yes stop_codon:yes gene_type:complete